MAVWTLAALLIWSHAQGFAHRIAHGGPAPVDAAGLSTLLWSGAQQHSEAPRPADLRSADSQAANHHSCAAFDAAAAAAATAVATLVFSAPRASSVAAQTEPPALRSRHFCAYFSRAPPSAS